MKWELYNYKEPKRIKYLGPLEKMTILQVFYLNTMEHFQLLVCLYNNKKKNVIGVILILIRHIFKGTFLTYTNSIFEQSTDHYFQYQNNHK